MIHGVIMAGGVGTRFWPKSRKKTPKQLLSIISRDSMIQETFKRLEQRIPAENIYVITNDEQANAVSEHLPGVPVGNVVAEPMGRNTAACIGLAAAKIAKADPEGTMVIVPADSYINPPENFLRVIDMACEQAQEDDTMVVIGIPPKHPATGYGYIHRGDLVQEHCGIKLFNVVEFKEKPDEETAREFLQSGNYYWNSGSFVWKVSTIMKAFQEFMPALYESLQRIMAGIGTEQEAQTIACEYQALESISIDYGVMEYARNVKVVEANYDWDDVGSWTSLENLLNRDTLGNVINGNLVMLDSSNCTVFGEEDHLLALVGVNDLIVVHTPDATLICSKERAQDVKKIVDMLHEKGQHEFL